MPRNTKYSSYWILSIWQCSVICLFHIYLCTKHDLQGKDIYFNFFCIHLYSYSHKLILQHFNANQCRGASVHPGRTTWSGCPSVKRGREGGRNGQRVPPHLLVWQLPKAANQAYVWLQDDGHQATLLPWSLLTPVNLTTTTTTTTSYQIVALFCISDLPVEGNVFNLALQCLQKSRQHVPS